MKKTILALLFIAIEAKAECLAVKPSRQEVVAACITCLMQSDITLYVIPIPPPPPPPSPPWIDGAPMYHVGPYDLVTWDFGDGTGATLVATDHVHHVYATNGMYPISARIDNCAGSETYYGSAAIAPNASTIVGFSQWIAYDVVESVGFVELELVRRGDTSIASHVLVSTLPRGYPPPGYPPFIGPIAAVAIPVTFEPGETSKSVGLEIKNDEIFTGNQICLVYLRSLDGTLVYPGALVDVIDDDPPPQVRIEDATAGESSGVMTFRINLDKTAGRFTSFTCEVTSGTAREGIDFVGSTSDATVPPGSQGATCKVSIIDDHVFERDETFNVTLRSRENVTIVRSRATGTIVDDEYEIRPASSDLAPGESRTLTIRVGMPYTNATVIPIEVSDPSIVRAPASIAFAAGATSAEFTITALRNGKAALFAKMPDYVRADINVNAPRRRGASH